MTLIFGVSLIYIYTSITYYNLVLRNSALYNEDVEFTYCDNFFHCFISFLNFGLRSGGGMGDNIQYPYYRDDHSLYVIRTVFDITFFILVVLVFINIVFAIIVDSFAELRDIRMLKGNPPSTSYF